MIPPRPVAHAIMNHAMPSDHAVFPRPVYKTAPNGLSSFFVGPKIIEINSKGPTIHPKTMNFCTRKREHTHTNTFTCTRQGKRGRERKMKRLTSMIKHFHVAKISYNFFFFFHSHMAHVLSHFAGVLRVNTTTTTSNRITAKKN